MLFRVRTSACQWVWVALALLALPSRAAAPAEFGAHRASVEAHQMHRWVLAQHNHRGQPFAIVDKKDARLFVFAGSGALLGSTPALLGLAPGDHSVPDIGSRPVSKILPAERTTPAGRFASEPGHNIRGEGVVWVDYDAGLAIHRLRPAAAAEARPQRLRSDTPRDNRITLGCVVVSVDFYERIVAPTLGRQRGIVYVLPETRSLQALLDATGSPAAADFQW
jgi:hypothetical protein